MFDKIKIKMKRVRACAHRRPRGYRMETSLDSLKYGGGGRKVDCELDERIKDETSLSPNAISSQVVVWCWRRVRLDFKGRGSQGFCKDYLAVLQHCNPMSISIGSFSPSKVQSPHLLLGPD